MGIGNLFFDFIGGKYESCRVEYLGTGWIRIEKLFKNDAVLKRPIEFLTWLDELGIPEPLHRWIEDEQRKKRVKAGF